MTAIIEREGTGYNSSCPELDIASQGSSVEEAKDNLREALELFFETASEEEITSRLRLPIVTPCTPAATACGVLSQRPPRLALNEN